MLDSLKKNLTHPLHQNIQNLSTLCGVLVFFQILHFLVFLILHFLVFKPFGSLEDLLEWQMMSIRWSSNIPYNFFSVFYHSLAEVWLAAWLFGRWGVGWLVGWLGEHLSRLDELIRQSGDHTIAICSVQCAAWNMNFKVCNVTKRVSRQCGTLHTVWVRNVELREELLGQMELGPD